jgi:DNA-binding response OmpR family regulator
VRNARLRVLIVDDEPDILLMLRVNLEAEGYETLLAGDGETALRRIVEEKPDVVLLDVMMPVLDGWGVLERLGPPESRPRVIVLTAKSSDRDLSRAWELGADEYVTKPFDPDLLLQAIETVAKTKPAERGPVEPLYVSDGRESPAVPLGRPNEERGWGI